MKVLSELGLNFQIAPKVFPVVETISALLKFAANKLKKVKVIQFFSKKKQQEYNKLFSLTSRNTMRNQKKQYLKGRMEVYKLHKEISKNRRTCRWKS